MYQYTFVLKNGETDNLLGNSLEKVLCVYLEKRENDILNGNTITAITIQSYPTTSKKQTVSQDTIQNINETFISQNRSVKDKNLDLALGLLQKL